MTDLGSSSLFLLPTRIYMQDLLLTLSRELWQSCKVTEKVSRKDSYSNFFFVLFNLFVYRNGSETADVGIEITLIIIWIHDHGCSAGDSHFLTFNNKDLCGSPHTSNHATLTFPATCHAALGIFSLNGS